MAVLLLAEEHDPSADLMVLTLDARGVEVHRLDTAWFPQSMTLNARHDGDQWRGTLRTAHRRVPLDSITAVWYRSPTAYKLPPGLNTAERAHANLEAKFGVGGVLSSLPAVWVNHPARNADAAYKPLQLATAARSGLTVPDTLITNDAEAVRKFAAEGPTITKLLGSSSIVEEGVRKIGYTRLLADDDLANLRGIEVTAHLFQRWVPKAHEARIIAVGDHLTTVAIHADSTAAHVDWRTDYDHLRYELTTPPEHVARGIQQLMHALGLRFGALDFVIRPDGEWVFLEINPTGQYGWLEHHTGAPITDHIADLLTKGTA